MKTLFLISSLFLLAACSPSAKTDVDETASAAVSAAASAALSFLTPPPDHRIHMLSNVDLDKSITLVGTDPLWNILFGDGRMVFSSPDSHKGRTLSTSFILNKDGAEWHDDDMDIYLIPVRCSDGRSDVGYPLRAVVHIGETVLKGCANNTSRIGHPSP